jgi:Na+/H+-dicarboxylate symporter
MSERIMAFCNAPNRLPLLIVLGMVLGIAVGFAVHQSGSASTAAIADYLRLLPDVFLKLIKMIIAPLVFATVVCGISGLGDTAALGRIGAKALGWFISASLVSLSLGLVLVNVFRPGAGLGLEAPDDKIGDLATKDLSLRHFVLEIFPSSAFDAMAKNNILQILVFSLFFGIGITAVRREQVEVLVQLCDALAHVMLQITTYVMRFAPFAVFGAMANVVATKGLGILVTYGVLVSEFYFGLALLWMMLLAVGGLFLRRRVFVLLAYIREPVLLTFSTASSEAGLPKLFEQLDAFGVPRRISGFVLPLGYSFNLDGSMMYMSFATIFVAQAYEIELTLAEQVPMLLTLMVSSKGIAGVPRASLVVIAATLSQFGLPVEGVALLLGIDTFLDMGRSATNVIGNAVATVVIAHSEGVLQPARSSSAGLDAELAEPAADRYGELDRDPEP